MRENDPHNLHRFLTAQDEDYEFAIEELRRGKKESHWIWYVFPQVAGLGSSSMAQDYAIASREEAVAYLDHPILSRRLQECCEALLPHRDSKIEDIMGFPDDLKLRSSLTLFASVSATPKMFQTVLDTFYGGQTDEKTIAFLNSTR
jgi:uncharacterized protein (DUF1810 family)